MKKNLLNSHTKCELSGGVFHLKKRVHYPEEIKWKVVEMKKEGYSNRTIMETLGVKNVSQIKRWMNWYHTNQTHRFQQPVGKQYSYGKGPQELSEIEQLRLENKHLKAQLLVWGKYLEIERS